MQLGRDEGRRGSVARRLLPLLASVAAGVGAGVIGYWITGEQAWFLAVPGAVALGWLLVANPEECVRTRSDD